MWFSTSLATDPTIQNEKERRVSLLQQIQRVLLIVVSLGFVVHISFRGLSEWPMQVVFAFAFSVIFGSIWLRLREQEYLAAWCFCVGLWTTVSLFTFVQGGKQPNSIQQYALVVVLSLLLLGVKETLLLSLLGLFTLSVHQFYGPFFPERELSLLMRTSATLVGFSLLLLFVLMLLSRTMLTVKATLERGWLKAKEVEITGMSTSSMEAMIDDMAESLLVLDSDGTLTRANPATCALLGFEEHELIGLSVRDVCPRAVPLDLDPLEALADKVQEEVFYRDKSGRLIPVLFTASVLKKDERDKPLSLVCIASDLSLRKEVELELLQAQRYAAEAEEVRTLFLHSLGQHFKAPLDMILQEVEQIRAEMRDEDRTQSDMERVESSAIQLLTLVNNTLDLARLDAGKMTMTLDYFPLEEVLDDLRDDIDALKVDNGNQFHLHVEQPNMTLYSDPEKVYRVLQEIVLNAFKFTSEGNVWLRVVRENRDNQPGVSLSIKDDGIGISAEGQRDIFQNFTQVDDSSTRLYDGTGIGLALCSQFTKMLGGSLELTSCLGEGSTFVCWFPTEPKLAMKPRSKRGSMHSRGLDS